MARTQLTLTNTQSGVNMGKTKVIRKHNLHRKKSCHGFIEVIYKQLQMLLSWLHISKITNVFLFTGHPISRANENTGNFQMQYRFFKFSYWSF